MKHVLITGAAGGIGRALCAEFAAAGWQVLATDLPDALPTSSGAPGPVTWLPLDLSEFVRDPDTRSRFAAAVHRHLENAAAPASLSCLVNNAALQRLGATAEVTADDWARSLDVNLVAPFLLAQTFLPELEAARGSVVNVASIHAQLTKPGFVVYATTKAALAGLTRALAVDLGPQVRVNAVCPAAISTPMLEAGFAGRPATRRQLDEFHPAGRIGEPAEVAAVIRWLAESPGFLTGTCVGLDGALAARLHDPG
jgi:NAD(P)-dependent dehydrogenase (short-subunit alcohol dehydrogenase family)